MSDQLVAIDGTQTIVAATHGDIEYALAVRVEGLLTRASSALLGPAVNALYAQALAAVRADQTLGGLCCEVREGAATDEGPAPSLEVDVAREPHAGPSAAFGLHLTVRYWRQAGQASNRETILGALTTAIALNLPSAELSVRERVLAALQAHLAAAVGQDVIRNADRPLAPAAGPVVVLLDGDQGVEHDTLGLSWYTATPAVEVFVPGASAAALDAVVSQVQMALQTAGRLGGLVLDVGEVSTDPEVLREQYSGPMLAARLTCEVLYATTDGDPYQEALL
jgi:hypothetical protein